MELEAPCKMQLMLPGGTPVVAPLIPEVKSKRRIVGDKCVELQHLPPYFSQFQVAMLVFSHRVLEALKQM